MNLSQLITARRDVRSYQELSAAGGGLPSASGWHMFATKDLRRFPEPQTILAVATALGVSPETVVLSAWESLKPSA